MEISLSQWKHDQSLFLQSDLPVWQVLDRVMDWWWSGNEPCPIPHDDIIKWKHFPRYWPFVQQMHRSPVNSPHKGQWCRILMFSLICTWINSWVNNCDDLRHHHAHYDVTVMHCLSMAPSILTDWDRDKMANILTTFSSAFSWLKMCKFWLKFHWSLFLRGS